MDTCAWGKKPSIMQLQHSFLLSYFSNLDGREKTPKTLLYNWYCHVDIVKKATCALRVELIRIEIQSLVKGTCHEMQNMNYFHRNTPQLKKSNSQDIHTCLKDKSQSRVWMMYYSILSIIKLQFWKHDPFTFLFPTNDTWNKSSHFWAHMYGNNMQHRSQEWNRWFGFPVFPAVQWQQAILKMAYFWQGHHNSEPFFTW